MILCRLFGHKWRFMGHSGMNDEPDYNPGYEVYECVRCGISCREKEDTGERELWY